jgi:hypothetical protein
MAGDTFTQRIFIGEILIPPMKNLVLNGTGRYFYTAIVQGRNSFFPYEEFGLKRNR